MFRILLVSDLPVLRHGLKVMFAAKPDEFSIVGETSSGNEAFRLTEQLNPDALVVDMHSTREEERDFLKSIKERFPDVKVIVLSDSETEDRLLQAIKIGVSGYLSEAADIEDVLRSIKTMMKGNFVLSPNYTDMIVRELSAKQDSILNLLTNREREILFFVIKGYTNKEIARQCQISSTTVKAHMRSILIKLEVKNRKGIIALAINHDLLDKLAPV